MHRKTKTALITGILGQDGSYLAELLFSKGYKIIGTSHKKSGFYRLPIYDIDIPIIQLDTNNSNIVNDVVKNYFPDEIYNLAARSSSAQLFDDPIMTIEVNGMLAARFLESIRNFTPNTRFLQASSSEVFANSFISPQDECTAYRPANAYGSAKVLATNLVNSYRSNFGIYAATAILYNHESPRRGHDYVSRKISYTVAKIHLGIETKLVLSSLDSKRDWGFAGDYVDAMWLILQQALADDYVIATGKTHSVRDFCQIAFSHVGLDYKKYVEIKTDKIRRTEHFELCGNSSKLLKLGWETSISFINLVKMMVDSDISLIKSNNI